MLFNLVCAWGKPGPWREIWKAFETGGRSAGMHWPQQVRVKEGCRGGNMDGEDDVFVAMHSCAGQ